MNDTFGVVLTTHISSAVACLVTFWIPMLSRKGGRVHVVSGKLYLALLLLTVVTAWALTVMAAMVAGARPDGTGMPLDGVSHDVTLYRLMLGTLAALALVTLAMAISGMRALKPDRGGRGVELGLFAVLALAGLGLAALGLTQTCP